MSEYSYLKATINANIKANNNQEITGPVMNSVLNAMVNTLGAGYQFAGVATTATNPGTPDAKVFYIANGKGTYTNFGSLEVTEDEVVVLYWDTAWHKEATGIASHEKLTELESETNELSSGINEYSLTPGINYYSLETGKTYILTNKSNYATNIGYYPSIEDAINDRNYTKIVTLNSGETYTFVAETNAPVIYMTKGSKAICFIKRQIALDINIEKKTDIENTISLLDKSLLSFPGYVDTNGVYQPKATTYKCTDYIPLNPKSSIRYKGDLSASVYAIAVYDESKNFSSIHSQLGNGGAALIEYCNNTTSMQYVRMSCKIVDFSNTNIWMDNVGLWATPYSWDYGNLGTDGEIIEPITNNRLHSTLIPIDGVDTISCDENQTLGYVLYDEDRNLVARYVAGVSELDIRYLALRYKNARYISILIRKVDNSNYDIASESPYINIIKGEVKTFIPQTIKLTPKEKLPVIIFNFDDCDLPGDYEVVKLFESRGIRCGFAFVATEEKLNDRSDVYLDFQKRGFDIMNHSGTIDAILTSNYSFDEAKNLIVSSGLERLQKKGFVINGFVCPNSQLSNDFLPIVAKTHAYNMLGQPYGSNGRDADINKLSRYSLESNTKETIKAYVDECIANDKCLIFYAHTTRFGTTINNELFDLNKVAEILDYVIEKRNNLECWVGGTDEGIKYYFDL